MVKKTSLVAIFGLGMGASSVMVTSRGPAGSRHGVDGGGGRGDIVIQPTYAGVLEVGETMRGEYLHGEQRRLWVAWGRGWGMRGIIMMLAE